MLNLPAQISCPEPGAPDAVEDMMHPDQRAIVAAGRKVNAMFETISQVNKNVLQVSRNIFLTSDQHCKCHGQPVFSLVLSSLLACGSGLHVVLTRSHECVSCINGPEHGLCIQALMQDRLSAYE